MTRMTHQCQAVSAQAAADAESERETRERAPATLFARIGGADGVARLVETFYGRMDTLPEARTIRDMHAPDLSATKEVLRRYLGEWMGGPKLYSAERGHPRLRSRHIRFRIGKAERDAWLTCMRQALDETVADAALRDELYEAMAKLANWMRNDPGNPHDVQHHGAQHRGR
ncbi:group II truncated hemoglobin [Methyloceanibacter methanicus]|uniref:group II truncated hemoglobin n=1 Tax=Methyloceanibacter methanicus TaxID=1774968 RepID=UPI000A9E9BD7|nr:group II truncated hemoglobin [Methyloceanibacter methanicus]